MGLMGETSSTVLRFRRCSGLSRGLSAGAQVVVIPGDEPVLGSRLYILANICGLQSRTNLCVITQTRKGVVDMQRPPTH
jgi:hypothetical protein